MLVTLKLSRQFYEKFGDQVANELVDAFNQMDATYRSDLKELNESNFKRFDAKLDARFAEFRTHFAEFEAKVDKRLGAYETQMERGFNAQLRFILLGLGTTVAAVIASVIGGAFMLR